MTILGHLKMKNLAPSLEEQLYETRSSHITERTSKFVQLVLNKNSTVRQRSFFDVINE